MNKTATTGSARVHELGRLSKSGAEIERRFRPLCDISSELLRDSLLLSQAYLDVLNLEGAAINKVRARRRCTVLQVLLDDALYRFELPKWAAKVLHTSHAKGVPKFRIRKQEGETGQTACFATIKDKARASLSGDAADGTCTKLVRREEEWEIPEELFAHLWDRSELRLRKRRHLLQGAPSSVHVDQFLELTLTPEEKELWWVEVEYKSEEQARADRLGPAPWIGPCVEVTGDVDHTSKAVARAKRPPRHPFIAAPEQRTPVG